MMTQADAISFAKSSALVAIDCANDYESLEDSIAANRENIRDTLNDEGANAHEVECFAVYDEKIAALCSARKAA